MNKYKIGDKVIDIQTKFIGIIENIENNGMYYHFNNGNIILNEQNLELFEESIYSLSNLEILESLYMILNTPIEKRKHGDDFNYCIKRLGEFIEKYKILSNSDNIEKLSENLITPDVSEIHKTIIKESFKEGYKQGIKYLE